MGLVVVAAVDGQAVLGPLADQIGERLRAAGAEVLRELHDTDYGSRDFAVLDPEGNHWSFGTYRGEARAI